MRNEKGQFVKGYHSPTEFKKGQIVWNKGTKGVMKAWNKGTKGIMKPNKTSFKKGQKHTEAFRQKMSEAHKGKPSGMLGKHHSEKTKIEMSKNHKGLNIWSKGKHCSSKTKFKKGQNLGEKNWNWKGGITPLLYQIRNCFKYRQWRSDIFTRDDFTCQKCRDNKGGNLEAHHIKSFVKILEENKITTLEQALNCEELWNINNGQTLCLKCHSKTDNYGNKKYV